MQAQIKENIKAQLAFVMGIHRSVTRKKFPFDDVIIGVMFIGDVALMFSPQIYITVFDINHSE